MINRQIFRKSGPWTLRLKLSVYCHRCADSVEGKGTCELVSPGSTHTHTHTRLMALFPGLPGRASTRKVKPIWILLKQETVSGSGISWAICKSAPRSRQITTPVPHHCFLQARCPSCHPTNSVKALKAWVQDPVIHKYQAWSKSEEKNEGATS